ncbi:MAG: hypothetical protein QW051_02095 [Candidatus Aenigmatarchaeota archaeon]
MRSKERFEEKLEEIIRELKDKLIIVEGKKDEKALKILGLKHIITINAQPLYKVVELAIKTHREIVILTDFDKKGKEINSKLKLLLQKKGKPPNTKLRCKVMYLEKNKIEDFGHLPKDLEINKEDDYHVKVSSRFNKIFNKSRNRGTKHSRKTRCNRSDFWSN